MNAERYADPTADMAVAHVDKEARRQPSGDLPRHVDEVLDIVRRVLSFAGLRIIHIEIEDKKSHKRWEWHRETKNGPGKQR